MDTSNPAVIDTHSPELPPVKRQRRSAELKRQIAEETLVAGASVARVARAHGVNANQVFAWRRQYGQGLLGPGSGDRPGLLAVRVAEAGAHPKGTERRRTPSGTIQIELPQGQLRVTGAVDSEALRVVLRELLG
jgi:transposase